MARIAIPLLVLGLLVALGGALAAAAIMWRAMPDVNGVDATPGELADTFARALSWVALGTFASVVLVVCGGLRLRWERKRRRMVALSEERFAPESCASE